MVQPLQLDSAAHGPDVDLGKHAGGSSLGSKATGFPTEIRTVECSKSHTSYMLYNVAAVHHLIRTDSNLETHLHFSSFPSASHFQLSALFHSSCPSCPTVVRLPPTPNHSPQQCTIKYSYKNIPPPFPSCFTFPSAAPESVC